MSDPFVKTPSAPTSPEVLASASGNLVGLLPAWGQAVLDELDHGLLVVWGQQVLLANHAARRHLEPPGALRCEDRRLRAADREVDEALQSALCAVQSRGLRRLVAHGAPGDDRAPTLALVPLQLAPGIGWACLLILGRSQVCEQLTLQGYARAHGLTAAEARVLQRLCDGEAPREIARSLGVALSTIRTQVASIRSKTGAADLRDLVRAVARLPPMMSALRLADSGCAPLGSADEPTASFPVGAGHGGAAGHRAAA